MMTKEEQLRALQRQCMLVPTWGWPVEEMAPAARAAGYTVVNSPHGNDLERHAGEARVYREAGLKMLVRPLMAVGDVWDEDEVRRAYETVADVIRFHRDDDAVVGFVIQWGLFGEGGFPWDYTYSEKARAAFNQAMGRGDAPLPAHPEPGQPGSLAWLQWLQFRSRTLVEFRRTFLSEAKKHTDKLVGTWTEFYPVENYVLNMGDAPGADFQFYDCSFGDYPTQPAMAFGETHGMMQEFETYEAWADYERPLAAHAAGLGVTPIGFQFPMREGHAPETGPGKYTVDTIEAEYALRFGAEIRRMLDTIQHRTRTPEVALVYHSYGAGALPAGPHTFPEQQAHVPDYFYNGGIRVVEGCLRQMGVDLRVIPHEFLSSEDLSAYKLVVLVDPMYLTPSMRQGLARAKRVLFCGEVFLTHHNPASASGDFVGGWEGATQVEGFALEYHRVPGGAVRVAAGDHPLMRGLDSMVIDAYPEDQLVSLAPDPVDAAVLARVGEAPMVVEMEKGRFVHVLNRFFQHARAAQDDGLERWAMRFLRNAVEEAGARVRVTSPQLARTGAGNIFGSYGLTGHVAWNATSQDLTLELDTGETVTVPAHGWTAVGLD